MNKFQIARNRFKPQKGCVLFIAESSPKGETFFYFENSNLYRAIKAGFGLSIGNKIGSDFLNYFKSCGCYLDDLCLEPINNLDNSNRLLERQKGIIPLSLRIKEFNPKGIVIVMKGIENEVKKAIALANLNSLEFTMTTSFPSFSETNRKNCIKDISEIVSHSISKNIISI